MQFAVIFVVCVPFVAENKKMNKEFCYMKRLAVDISWQLLHNSKQV